eukprot:CAMPEP_0114365832 /NCGR_PEP_ID=MMETSP0101-20121206/28730_1 /TAXON_ID=38822 ORGANISM="Pteridomonas danica, Strain PT" /NCGR_SAMPLE_ID=MMETSP0101 /ASSEMBLY_ACC=CAM_ASM_000211 /LENGTH=82 /DNA_ID=CAMNT_0001514407 /DNA_START=163 /DNA_END=408 /DNA_ORIENTATION=+
MKELKETVQQHVMAMESLVETRAQQLVQIIGIEEEETTRLPIPGTSPLGSDALEEEFESIGHSLSPLKQNIKHHDPKVRNTW